MTVEMGPGALYIFFFIGIAFIALGIWSLFKEKKDKIRKAYNATVTNCTFSMMSDMGNGKRWYDVTVEIWLDYGVTYKTIRTDKLFNTGDTCQVYYDPQNDKAEFAIGYRQSKSKGGLILIGVGILWCILIGLAMFIVSGGDGSEIGGTLFGVIVCFIFIFIGVYGTILKPIQQKKEMEYCKVVIGSVIDYTRKRGSKGKKMYCPTYGYYNNGVQETMRSTVSSSSKKRCEIGREVTIVINNRTGKVYCKEDEKTFRNMCIVFLIFGIVFMAAVLSETMTTGQSDREDAPTIDRTKNTAYSEYSYVPNDKSNNAYGYTIKVYNNCVGEITIFPMKSNGNSINQSFTFYVDESALTTVIEDVTTYYFGDIAGENADDKTEEGSTSYEYIYYYDGNIKFGSGGYDIEAPIFVSVAKHIKECVPRNVWNDIEEEIDRYYNN